MTGCQSCATLPTRPGCHDIPLRHDVPKFESGRLRNLSGLWSPGRAGSGRVGSGRGRRPSRLKLVHPSRPGTVPLPAGRSAPPQFACGRWARSNGLSDSAAGRGRSGGELRWVEEVGEGRGIGTFGKDRGWSGSIESSQVRSRLVGSDRRGRGGSARSGRIGVVREDRVGRGASNRVGERLVGDRSRACSAYDVGRRTS